MKNCYRSILSEKEHEITGCLYCHSVTAG